MTVKDLIAILEQVPQDDEVRFATSNDSYDIESLVVGDVCEHGVLKEVAVLWEHKGNSGVGRPLRTPKGERYEYN